MQSTREIRLVVKICEGSSVTGITLKHHIRIMCCARMQLARCVLRPTSLRWVVFLSFGYLLMVRHCRGFEFEIGGFVALERTVRAQAAASISVRPSSGTISTSHRLSGRGVSWGPAQLA